ncbi:MAG: CotH kinase family protein [Flavobacteriaceae bacterium]
MRFQTVFFLMVLCVGCNGDDVDQTTQQEGTNEEQTEKDGLPHFYMDTKGEQIVDEPKISSDARIEENGTIIFQGNMGIEFRGASSQALFPKKSYGLETWDESNNDIDVSLLGLPEEEDWILYGPYSDKTLMRNILIYDLSREMGRYASRGKFVDLTLNDNYQGVYIFMEKLKRDGQRIDINKLKEDEISGDDVTGGYILKIDKTAGNNLGEGYNVHNSFVSAHAPPHATQDQKVYFLYEYPDAEDIVPEQKDYISQYITDFENALASEDFTDAEHGYNAYIDVDSFIDFFILNEVANNVDAYRLSTFMHKEKNGKLHMGPIWDFNLAFGNANYCGGGDTQVWAYKFNERCPEDFWLVPFWWERLLQDPLFVSRLKNRWIELRGNQLSNERIEAHIEGYLTTLEDTGSIQSNFTTWPIIGTYIWPNNHVGNSYKSDLDYMRNWLENRFLWLDNAIEQL